MNTSMTAPHKYAIFGGTFDPVHKGHMHVIDAVFTHTDYTHLFCIPTAHNPFKSVVPTASAHDRLAMLSIACKPYSHITIVDYEISTKNAHTIDTVTHIIQTYNLVERPGLIIGADIVRELSHWDKVEELQRLITLIVIPRPHISLNREDKELLRHFETQYIDDITLVDISASQLRKDRTLLKNAVLPEVWDYIYTKKLYT